MSKGSVNKVILIGRLGKDPDVKYTAGGTAVANFSLATSETFKKEGEKQEKTEWHKIVIFGKLAEIAGEYLKKGSQIYLEGKLQTRSWGDKDGVERYTTEIVLSEMTMLGGRSDNSGPDANPKKQAEKKKPASNEPDGAPPYDDDDLPF